jgi:hypothetical protein
MSSRNYAIAFCAGLALLKTLPVASLEAADNAPKQPNLRGPGCLLAEGRRHVFQGPESQWRARAIRGLAIAGGEVRVRLRIDVPTVTTRQESAPQLAKVNDERERIP